MQIYSGPLSMFGAKVEIAAREKGIDFELVMVPFNPATGYNPRHPAVLRVNPKRQVPVLIDGALELFDSTLICEYIEDINPTPALWPLEAKRRAMARLLEHQSDEVFFPHVNLLMMLEETPDAAATHAARAAIEDYYRRMESLLANGEYLAGSYSYADIAFYMAQLFAARKGAPMMDGTPNLLAWRARLTARRAVQKVVHPMARYLTSIGRAVPEFLTA